MLLVEHDMDFVMSLADRIVVLDFGVKDFRRPAGGGARGSRVREAYLGNRYETTCCSPPATCASPMAASRPCAAVTIERRRARSSRSSNGASKTTLLNAIMGVLPSSGVVSLRGCADPADAARGARRARPCLVPERRRLFANMSVADNLELGGFRRSGRRARRRWNRSRALSRAEGAAGQEAGTCPAASGRCSPWGPRADGAPAPLMLGRTESRTCAASSCATCSTSYGTCAARRDDPLVEQNARAALQIADYAYVLELAAVSAQGHG